MGSLRSISWRESAARADVTGSADTAKTYVTGVPDNEVTVSIVGGAGATIDVGDIGALWVYWRDVGSSIDGTLSDRAQVSDVQTDGSMDGEIITQITFVPHPAA
jgi:hypothetical protein